MVPGRVTPIMGVQFASGVPEAVLVAVMQDTRLERLGAYLECDSVSIRLASEGRCAVKLVGDLADRVPLSVEIAWLGDRWHITMAISTDACFPLCEQTG